MSQGWALGKLDSDGNPTEDAEPDKERASTLYIQELKYNGTDLEMYVDPEFANLPESEKKTTVNNALGHANVIVGSAEDWEQKKYQDRLFVTIYSGKNVLGRSKISDPFDFKWND